ncbi:MAG: GPR endopeptidase [Oscillospiraceae bacterium]|nr:GPR endopeptidase [Oscillospiraceae bacterium]
MEIRTDLALERAGELEEGGGLPRGVSVKKEHRHGIESTVVTISTKAGEGAIGKPKGTYVTVELGSVLRREKGSFDGAVACIADYLRGMLKLPNRLPVLVAGLGNREVTPDAIGPLTADHILVTRHMVAAVPETFGEFRPVSATVPGVLGTTGVESAETVRALVERIGAAAVIAVDALAARDTGRLCSTLQISNTGISPGSGIGNRRNALDQKTIGCPVIALGVPTVTDAATMASDLFQRAGMEVEEEQLRKVSTGMIVTSGDIDRRVREIARVLAYSINGALHEDLTLEELTDLTF